jgi:hypothetical protein
MLIGNVKNLKKLPPGCRATTPMPSSEDFAFGRKRAGAMLRLPDKARFGRRNEISKCS